MIVLICYDVANRDDEGRRRLRKISRLCKDHGVRVQYSIFECRLDEPTWIQLRARLLDVLAAGEDSLRVYYLDADQIARTEHHGAREPLDVTGPLVV